MAAAFSDDLDPDPVGGTTRAAQKRVYDDAVMGRSVPGSIDPVQLSLAPDTTPKVQTPRVQLVADATPDAQQRRLGLNSGPMGPR